MSRTTPEERMTGKQLAALIAAIAQELGQQMDFLNPTIVQHRMTTDRHGLMQRLLWIFIPDAEDWITAYRGLYKTCGKAFDYKLEEAIRRDFRRGWWPIAVQSEIPCDILWACKESIGMHVEHSIKEDVDIALASHQVTRLTWVKAEVNVRTSGPDDSTRCISLLEWLTLAYALYSLTGEHLDGNVVDGTLMKANGGIIRAYQRRSHNQPEICIEPWNPKWCKALPRERFDRPVDN